MSYKGKAAITGIGELKPTKRPDVEERLKELITEIAVKHQAEIIEMEIMPEHVHLLVEVDPQYGIHRLIRQIKGQTSRLLRQEYPWLKSRIPTLWTNSYFVSTVGGGAACPN